jgi:hypothetical protein
MYLRLCRDARTFTIGTLAVFGILLGIDEFHQRLVVFTSYSWIVAWTMSTVAVLVFVIVFYTMMKFVLYSDIMKDGSNTSTHEPAPCTVSTPSSRRAHSRPTIPKRP